MPFHFNETVRRTNGCSARAENNDNADSVRKKMPKAKKKKNSFLCQGEQNKKLISVLSGKYVLGTSLRDGYYMHRKHGAPQSCSSAI